MALRFLDAAGIGHFIDMIIRCPGTIDLDVQSGFARSFAKSRFGEGRAADIAEADEEDGRLGNVGLPR